MAKEKGTQDRPYWSAVVIDGETVKLRIQAERIKTKSQVHVDWCRFTVQRRNAPAPSVDLLFPAPVDLTLMSPASLEKRLPLQDVTADEFAAAAEAFTIANDVCKALGPDFSVWSEPLKGMDFYKFRWSIHLNGSEVGWVGYLGCVTSPRQTSQDRTIHVNLHGMACTFAASGWRDRIADICDDLEATLTRCDLALDFFDGLEGGMNGVREQYRDGLCNVNGRKLKFSMCGDWENGHGRSVYIGSRESGKVTNVYEKGDQLYGEKFGSDWIRAELRYGNSQRFLSIDMLRRPADFFASASDWHMHLIHLAAAICTPEAVPTTPRLTLETIQGEAVRYTRWLVQTAGPALAAAVQFLPTDDLWEAIKGARLPGRLSKFSRADLERHVPVAFRRFSDSEALAA